MSDPQTAPAIIRFDRGWVHSVEGDLRRGDAVLLDYDFARLPNCRGERLGVPSWRIEAHVRFHPGGQYVYRELGPDPATLTIPPDTSQIEMWFKNWDARFCQAYDSRFGENYWFEVRE